MKKFIGILMCLAMVLTIVACGSTSENSTTEESKNTENSTTTSTEKKGKIGACVLSLSYDFQVNMCNGIQRAADEFGYEAMIYDYNADIEQMLTGLDTLKASNVKALYGIFGAPQTATSFMLENPEIGVLTQGASVEGCQAWTVNDYVALGEQFIEALEKHVTKNNITSGNIGALWLENCQNPDDDFYQAKQDVEAQINAWCDAHEGFEYVHSEYYPKDDEEAANMTAQIMNADSNAKFLFCFNNGYGVAAANEISSAVSDASEYFVFTSEGDDEVFRLISGGTSPLRACAYANIEESGYQVGLQLINWIENGVMESVPVAKDLVDIDNVADYIQ